jgi:hypothetical protein
LGLLVAALIGFTFWLRHRGDRLLVPAGPLAALGLVFLLSSLGLLARHRWAWYASLLLAAVALVVMLVRVGLGLATFRQVEVDCMIFVADLVLLTRAHRAIWRVADA